MKLMRNLNEIEYIGKRKEVNYGLFCELASLKWNSEKFDPQFWLEANKKIVGDKICDSMSNEQTCSDKNREISACLSGEKLTD